MLEETLTLSPTQSPGRFRTPDGRLLSPPEGWVLLPPGDAALTRRVKTAGPSWSVVEKRGRKTFSRGVWAPAENVAAARAALEEERSRPEYARRRATDARRRERDQAAYTDEFERAVLDFLAFVPPYEGLALALARAVAAHATPIGSGTVARTRRISIEDRAEAAVIAWLRHQTTDYDERKIARVKGERRRVRHELAVASRNLLNRHRTTPGHPVEGCMLCSVLTVVPTVREEG